MHLREIVCQEKAVGALEQAYAAGKIAHAYLFAGDDGVGKRTTAAALAKMLLCENRQTCKSPEFVDSCGKCHSCQTFEAGGHPDFRMITKELVKFTREGKNKTTPVQMPIDVIREFLIERIANKPSMGSYVVFVLDEAEKVNNASQNAMLKVLEEPPGHCVIILLCSRPDLMLPTTLSRCQVVRFGPVSEDEIVKRLVQDGLAKTEAVFWARFSQGSLGQAIAWSSLRFKEGSIYGFKKELVERVCSFGLADVVDMAEWMGQTARKISGEWVDREQNVSTTDINRRAQKGLIKMTSLVYSDVMRLGLAIGELVNDDQKSLILRLADKLDPEAAAVKVEFCATMDKWVDSSVNEKLIFEQLLFNLSKSDILLSSTA
ncbi:MAG: DNA polymerase III subunit [Planctomycetaceae bacterium]|nr:DNA polymerase III subunit [Planctomycetaceae bacterium]